MIRPLHWTVLGVLLGVGLVLVGGLFSSLVTRRQAILAQGLYPMPNPPLDLGDLVFVRNDDQQITNIDLLCRETGPTGDLARNAQKAYGPGILETKWLFSDQLAWVLPWPTQQSLQISDYKTFSSGEYLEALFARWPSCESIIRKRIVDNDECLLVVSALIEAADGKSPLIGLAGCQLVGIYEDGSSPPTSSAPSGQRIKDRFAGIARWERLWNSFRSPYLRPAIKKQ